MTQLLFAILIILINVSGIQNLPGNTNHCDNDTPCLNNGRCITNSTLNQNICKCPDWAVGDRCQFLNPCLHINHTGNYNRVKNLRRKNLFHNTAKRIKFAQKCKHDSNCQILFDNSNLNKIPPSFKCHCSPGYLGTYCDTPTSDNICHQAFAVNDNIEQIGQITQGPCRNHGTCHIIDGNPQSYKCDCPDSHIGKNCEIPNPCHHMTNAATCQNNGKCLLNRTAMVKLTEKTILENLNSEELITCECPSGFTGRRCESDVDECDVQNEFSQPPCFNHGTCLNIPGSYKCLCPIAFTGEHCEKPYYPCNPSPCQHNGICVITGDYQYTCQCPPGFSGNDCEININECALGHRCENGGTCLDRVNSYTCQCPTQYKGNFCEQDVDECALGTDYLCKNGGTCVNTHGSYYCACVNGWTGQDCSINIDDCAVPEGSNQTSVCMNGGICHDRVGSYYCECPTGKTGLLCHLEDVCETANPCGPGSLCETNYINGDFQCTCRAGMEGPLCDIDIDECQLGLLPCEHGGTCVNTRGAFECACEPGFSGPRCEINNDECAVHPCLNDGTCLDEINKYTCVCMPGYTGERCEVNINECQPNPCHNNGLCIDGIDNFICRCPTGYYGNTCEQKYQLDTKDLEINPCIPQNFVGMNKHFNNYNYDDSADQIKSNSMSKPCFNGGICTDILLTGKNNSSNKNLKSQSSYDSETDQNISYYNYNDNDDEVYDENVINILTNFDVKNRSMRFKCNCTWPFYGPRCEFEEIRNQNFDRSNTSTIENKNREIQMMTSSTFHKILDGMQCESRQNPCLNNAKCIDLSIKYSMYRYHAYRYVCQCEPGFTGVFCEINSTHLLTTAANKNDSFSYASLFPKNFLPPHINDKQKEQTRNLTICMQVTLLENGLSLQDMPEYEINQIFANSNLVMPMMAGPCNNGGTCIETSTTSRSADIESSFIIGRDWKCECKPGFTGQKCEQEIDECQLYYPLVETNDEQNPEKSQYIGLSRNNLVKGLTLLELHQLYDTYNNNGFQNNAALASNTSKHNNYYLFESSDPKTVITTPLGNYGQGPCLHNGRCLDYVASWVCECPAGWEGQRCHINSADCSATSCLNGGTCIDGIADYSCVCPAGFQGKHCESRVDPCHVPSKIVCQNGGYCRSSGGSANISPENLNENYTLKASSSYVAKNSVTGSDFSCVCPPGFYGMYCEKWINPCNPHYDDGSIDSHFGLQFLGDLTATKLKSGNSRNPCANGGICTPLNINHPVNRRNPEDHNQNLFECKCAEGWIGETCEIRMVSCQTMRQAKKGQAVCAHGGKCIDIVIPTNAAISLPLGSSSEQFNYYKCQCSPGYSGAHCEIMDDECQIKNPCLNGATCINTRLIRSSNAHIFASSIFEQSNTKLQIPKTQNYLCECPSGFDGVNCERNIDDCKGNPCKNGGICHDLINDFRCTCPPGTLGFLCETNINECSNVMCHHGGTCIDKIGGFQCICPPGFVGKTCEGDVNECLAHPCNAVGTRDCIQLDNDFQCVCRPGFSGKLCDTKTDVCHAEQNKCANNAKCLIDPRSYKGFRCQCEKPWSGEYCDTIVRTCQTHPCRTDEYCLEPLHLSSKNGNNRRCFCDSDYTIEVHSSQPEENHKNASRCHKMSQNFIVNNITDNTDIVENLISYYKSKAHTTYEELEKQHKLLVCRKAGCPKPETMLTNGVCEPECNVAACNWDGKDCSFGVDPWDKCVPDFSLSLYDPGLPLRFEPCWKLYGDDRCDPQCNNRGCLFDGFDCQSIPNVRNSTNILPNNNEDSNKKPESQPTFQEGSLVIVLKEDLNALEERPTDNKNVQSNDDDGFSLDTVPDAEEYANRVKILRSLSELLRVNVSFQVDRWGNPMIFPTILEKGHISPLKPDTPTPTNNDNRDTDEDIIIGSKVFLKLTPDSRCHQDDKSASSYSIFNRRNFGGKNLVSEQSAFLASCNIDVNEAARLIAARAVTQKLPPQLAALISVQGSKDYSYTNDGDDINGSNNDKTSSSIFGSTGKLTATFIACIILLLLTLIVGVMYTSFHHQTSASGLKGNNTKRKHISRGITWFPEGFKNIMKFDHRGAYDDRNNGKSINDTSFVEPMHDTEDFMPVMGAKRQKGIGIGTGKQFHHDYPNQNFQNLKHQQQQKYPDFYYKDQLYNRFDAGQTPRLDYYGEENGYFDDSASTLTGTAISMSTAPRNDMKQGGNQGHKNQQPNNSWDNILNDEENEENDPIMYTTAGAIGKEGRLDFFVPTENPAMNERFMLKAKRKTLANPNVYSASPMGMSANVETLLGLSEIGRPNDYLSGKTPSNIVSIDNPALVHMISDNNSNSNTQNNYYYCKGDVNNITTDKRQQYPYYNYDEKSDGTKKFVTSSPHPNANERNLQQPAYSNIHTNNNVVDTGETCRTLPIAEYSYIPEVLQHSTNGQHPPAWVSLEIDSKPWQGPHYNPNLNLIIPEQIDALGPRGITPLMVSATVNTGQDGKINNDDNEQLSTTNVAIHTLIKQGANVEHKTEDTLETPLHLAARFARADSARYLLEAGADLNATDYMGRTPLYTAIACDAIGVIHLLLRYVNSSSPSLNNKGLTTAANNMNNKSQLSGPESAKESHHQKQPKIGLDLDAQSLDGSTPLMLAARICSNDSPIPSLLIEAGADLTLLDENGRTALHWASAVNNYHMVELLLKNGASPDVQDAKDETPLFLAAREGAFESARILTSEYKANTEIVNNVDMLPCDIARERMHMDICQLIESRSSSVLNNGGGGTNNAKWKNSLSLLEAHLPNNTAATPAIQNGYQVVAKLNENTANSPPTMIPNSKAHHHHHDLIPLREINKNINKKNNSNSITAVSPASSTGTQSSNKSATQVQNGTRCTAKLYPILEIAKPNNQQNSPPNKNTLGSGNTTKSSKKANQSKTCASSTPLNPSEGTTEKVVMTNSNKPLSQQSAAEVLGEITPPPTHLNVTSVTSVPNNYNVTKGNYYPNMAPVPSNSHYYYYHQTTTQDANIYQNSQNHSQAQQQQQLNIIPCREPIKYSPSLLTPEKSPPDGQGTGQAVHFSCNQNHKTFGVPQNLNASVSTNTLTEANANYMNNNSLVDSPYDSIFRDQLSNSPSVNEGPLNGLMSEDDMTALENFLLSNNIDPSLYHTHNNNTDLSGEFRSHSGFNNNNLQYHNTNINMNNNTNKPIYI